MHYRYSRWSVVTDDVGGATVVSCTQPLYTLTVGMSTAQLCTLVPHHLQKCDVTPIPSHMQQCDVILIPHYLQQCLVSGILNPLQWYDVTLILRYLQQGDVTVIILS